jgi:putative membrane protein
MRPTLITCLAVVALTVPALAQSIGEKTGINSLTGTAPKTVDFVKEAAIGGMYEVEAAKIAQQKATDEQTRKFAQQMVTDHSKANDQLKAKAKAANIEIPTALDKSHQDKIDKMKSKSPQDFTKDYRSDMVSDHKTDVSLFERYSKGGDNAELKAWAGATLPTLQHHLQMAQDMNKQAKP